MDLPKVALSAVGGYVIGTFPTRHLAARMAAGRQDVNMSDVDPKAPSTEIATVVAILAKMAISCLGGLRLAGPLGLAAAGGGCAAGDHFPLWRLVKSRRKRPAAVSG